MSGVVYAAGLWAPMIAALATRLRQQQLVIPSLAAPEDVVSWMGAVQAQEFGPACWGIGQRMAAATDATVEAAFDAVGSSELMCCGRRGISSIHVTSGGCSRSARRACTWPTGSRIGATVSNQRSASEANRSSRVLSKGTRYLTRTELAAALRRARLPHAGQALAHMVMHAELEGVLCSGPRRGKSFTYALLDERVPPAPLWTADAAVAELARRYFASHGPATLRDFTWWSGLTMAQARAGIAQLGPALEPRRIDGRSCWQAPDVGASPHRTAVVRLLPIYDEFLVAYRDRAWVSSRVAGPQRGRRTCLRIN